jgi:holliday junction DNA helicase RuvA
MLGYLQGKIISKNPDSGSCVVLMHRLGFEVTVPKRLGGQLLVGQKVSFWIHTHVREDALTLFGFATELEKHFFRQLVGVSGLGPKTALSLLGEHGAEKLIHLILEKESSEIAKAPGVGKKLAERLILELSGKIEKWAWIEKRPEVEACAAIAASPKRQLREDLSSALAHLGYVPAQIKSTLDKLLENQDLEEIGFEACLKAALQEMSGRVTKSNPIQGDSLIHG